MVCDWPTKQAAGARVAIANRPPRDYTVKITRVGYRHNDCSTTYLDLGSPAGLPDQRHLLPKDVLTKLRASCVGAPDTQKVTVREGKPRRLDLTMNGNHVCLISVEP